MRAGVQRPDQALHDRPRLPVIVAQKHGKAADALTRDVTLAFPNFFWNCIRSHSHVCRGTTQCFSHGGFPMRVHTVNLKDIFRQIQTYPNNLHDTPPSSQLMFEIPPHWEGGVHTIAPGDARTFLDRSNVRSGAVIVAIALTGPMLGAVCRRIASEFSLRFRPYELRKSHNIFWTRT